MRIILTFGGDGRTCRSPFESSISSYRLTIPTMANAFDPYREALVMEQVTVWGPLNEQFDPAEQEEIAAKLHTAAEDACELEYQRTHTGFCRVITVTEDDLQRLQVSRS